MRFSAATTTALRDRSSNEPKLCAVLHTKSGSKSVDAPYSCCSHVKGVLMTVSRDGV